MTVIVIDASSLAKYFLKERGGRDVRDLIDARSTVYSVDLVVKEVANAVWKRVKILKSMDEDRAQLLFESLLELVEKNVIVLEPEGEYIRKAYRISMMENVTVYDSLYVALAEKLGELVTSDKAQAEIAAKHGVKTLFIP